MSQQSLWLVLSLVLSRLRWNMTSCLDKVGLVLSWELEEAWGERMLWGSCLHDNDIQHLIIEKTSWNIAMKIKQITNGLSNWNMLARCSVIYCEDRLNCRIAVWLGNLIWSALLRGKWWVGWGSWGSWWPWKAAMKKKCACRLLCFIVSCLQKAELQICVCSVMEAMMGACLGMGSMKNAKIGGG